MVPALGPIEEYNIVNGGSPFQSQWPEAASQSYAINELVYLASGKLTVCAADAVSIWGLAKQAASGTTDTARLVVLLSTADFLSMSTYHGTPASAITAVADIGAKFAIYRDTANKWHHIDVGDTGNDALVPVKIVTTVNSPVGTQYGRYICRLLPAVIQSQVAA